MRLGFKNSLLLLCCLVVFLPFGRLYYLRGQVISCGNGIMEGKEACDDGNENNYDGCSTGCDVLTGWSCSGSPSACTHLCGNGVIDPDSSEQCDDYANKDGDGCSRECAIEPFFACEGQPSVCHCVGTAVQCRLFSCGDGVAQAGEQCDDRNKKNADGCSEVCATEKGYLCKPGSPSVCSKQI